MEITKDKLRELKENYSGLLFEIGIRDRIKSKLVYVIGAIDYGEELFYKDEKGIIATMDWKGL